MGFASERPHRLFTAGLGLAWVPSPLELPPLVLPLARHARCDAGPVHASLREHAQTALRGRLQARKRPRVGSAR
ncbi:hypothetical protein DMH08_15365 [Actinomadura sp. WAC 06369]|nr:hypothetical protein DMH08_15365 [Actinomadura sp. WAC 06369]